MDKIVINNIGSGARKRRGQGFNACHGSMANWLNTH